MEKNRSSPLDRIKLTTLITIILLANLLLYSPKAANEKQVSKQATTDVSVPEKNNNSGKDTSPPPDKTKKEEVVIPVADQKSIENYIYYGVLKDGLIINPVCIDTDLLLQSIPEAQEAEKFRRAGREAKFWIMQSQASDKMWNQVSDYIKEKNSSQVEGEKINLLFSSREKLFKLLRQQEKYKDKKDAELIAQFDITDKIIKRFGHDQKKKK